MSERRIEREIWLPAEREEVFAFFADAGNLDELTPPWLRFAILTPLPLEMRAGARIDYRIRIRGVPVLWQTEISVWEPPGRFVDEQIRGPYRRWHHTHTFEERDGGTLMTDVVDYAVPGGPFEPLVHRLFVRRDVERIFDYRALRMRELFGSQSRSAAAG